MFYKKWNNYRSKKKRKFLKLHEIEKMIKIEELNNVYVKYIFKKDIIKGDNINEGLEYTEEEKSNQIIINSDKKYDNRLPSLTGHNDRSKNKHNLSIHKESADQDPMPSAARIFLSKVNDEEYNSISNKIEQSDQNPVKIIKKVIKPMDMIDHENNFKLITDKHPKFLPLKKIYIGK